MKLKLLQKLGLFVLAVYLSSHTSFSLNLANAQTIATRLTPDSSANVYYSVGQSSSDLKTGNPTIGLTSGVAVFSMAQTGNIGVGDEVKYGTNSIAFISGKTREDDAHWTLVTPTGGIPLNVANAQVLSITRAFTSLNEAISGFSDSQHLANANLVNAHVTVNLACYYDKGPDTTTVYIPNSISTGPANYVNIYTPSNTSTQSNISQRHTGRWTMKAYQLVVTNGYAAIDIHTNYVRITGLQIEQINTPKSAALYPRAIRLDGLGGSGGYILVDANIIRGEFATAKSPAGIGNFGSPAKPTLVIVNNIVYGFVVENIEENPSAIVTMNGTAYIYNNTVFHNYQGFQTADSGATYKNNIAQRDTVGYNVGSGANSSSTNNLSDQEDAPGANPLNAAEVIFANPDAQDFHLALLNQFDAIGAGVNLASDSNFSFNDDVDGQTRFTETPWDVGADQYSAGKTILPTITRFLMPSTASSPVVSVSSFTSSASTTPTVAYLITESAETPSLKNPNWSETPPRVFIFSGAGAHTAFAWVMDAYGSISQSVCQTVTIASIPAPVTYSSVPVSPNLFSQNWNSSAHWPSVPFGGIRLWDTGTNWSQIEKIRGQYNWVALDQWLANARTYNKDVLYTFGVTPPWASMRPSETCPYGGKNGCAAPPLDVSSGDAFWTEFVTAVVEHSLASATAHIKYYELWNECDIWYWTGTNTQMATMANDAYAIIHRLDPNAVVLGPNVTGFVGPAWLESYYSSGGSPSVDIVAFHAYKNADNIGSFFQDIGAYRAVMAKHGLAEKPLWSTEGSWGVDTTMTSDEQAAWLARSYLSMWQAGVARAYWYAWDNQPYAPYRNSGWGQLWDPVTGVHPSGTALGQLYRWLVGSTSPAPPCFRTVDNTWRCNLALSNGNPAQIVWNLTASTTLSVSPAFTTYQTLDNDAQHLIANHVITIGPKPILLVVNIMSRLAVSAVPTP